MSEILKQPFEYQRLSSTSDRERSAAQLLGLSPSESPSLVPTLGNELQEAEVHATKVVKCFHAQNSCDPRCRQISARGRHPLQK